MLVTSVGRYRGFADDFPRGRVRGLEKRIACGRCLDARQIDAIGKTGSLGAAIFNKIVPQALRALTAEQRPEIWHQTGRGQRDATERLYEKNAVTTIVAEFIDDMAAAYGWADVVICRAGAMTIAELCAAGVAAILVPYPSAVDDHQTANARFPAERQAAILVPQPDFSVTYLAEMLQSFTANRALLLKMATNARACATPDATETVTRLCMEVTHA